uniref:RNA helicase n=2 Tax=Schistocephalus solidus TaxID=70667 RepID=A0A0X3NUD5_SCHSO
MVEFNPEFSFEDKDTVYVPAVAEFVSEDAASSNRRIDTLIKKYFDEKTKTFIEEQDKEIEVEEEEQEGVKCKITDSIRAKKNCKKRKRAGQEEEEAEKEAQYDFFQSVKKYADVDSFIGFKLSKPVLKALTDMNMYKPTPIQCACVPLALINRDICACARTGSGKTLAFLLPIVDRMVYTPTSSRRSTRALVISPTRELAVQIFKVAEQLVKYCPKLKIQLAAGGLDLSSQEASLRTNPDIVVATPGRLIDHISNAPNFSLHEVEYLVLDEADKLLDEYFTEQICEILRHCSTQKQTLLFSATMTETVRELATVSLRNPVRVFLNESTAVADKLQQEFVRIRPQKEADRDSILAALLVRSFPKRTIVFLPTKKDCHRMHVLLGLMGLHCAELHGDMLQSQRLEALRRFTEDSSSPQGTSTTSSTTAVSEGDPKFRAENSVPPVDILLATDLAARGLDIPHVQTVINYRLPRTMKQYVHRVGRTARATNTGRAVSLAGESDRKLLKEIIKDAPYPIKARSIPQEVIARFKARITKIEPFLKEILDMEAEERELQAAESQLAKAERLAAERAAGSTGSSTAAPPFQKRTNWFSEKRDAEREAKRASAKNKSQKNLPSKRPRKGA